MQLANYVSVVQMILEDNPKIALELANAVDMQKRFIEHIACPEAQKLLKRVKYFLKR